MRNVDKPIIRLQPTMAFESRFRQDGFDDGPLVFGPGSAYSKKAEPLALKSNPSWTCAIKAGV